jgi:hypothetical protein
VANCLVAYVRLVELGKEDIAYPSVLAMYAVRQIREGRRVGTKMNVRDISSTYCQLAKGITVKRLDHYDHDSAEWLEIVVEDGQATPADIAATRIDFAAWLDTLSGRLRRVAEFLATGETTSAAANKFSVSAGRISQLRRRLMRSWEVFQRERCCEVAVGINTPAGWTLDHSTGTAFTRRIAVYVSNCTAATYD